MPIGVFIPRELYHSREAIALWLQLMFPNYIPCDNCDFAKIHCRCQHIIRSDN